MSVTFHLTSDRTLSRVDHEVLGDRNRQVAELTERAVRKAHPREVLMDTWTVDLREDPVLPIAPGTFFLFERKSRTHLLYPYPLGVNSGPVEEGRLVWSGPLTDPSRVLLYNKARFSKELTVSLSDMKDAPRSDLVLDAKGSSQDHLTVPWIAGGACVLLYQKRDRVDYATSVLQPGRDYLLVSEDLENLGTLVAMVDANPELRATVKANFAKTVSARLREDALCDRIIDLLRV
jgi:hypothetical protein